MAYDQGFENVMWISLGHIFGRLTHVSNDHEKKTIYDILWSRLGSEDIHMLV